MNQFSHIGAVLYGPTALSIKLAILINWLRIFVPQGQRNTTYWIIQTHIWANVLFYGITTITEIFRCWPREKIWNILYQGGGRCPINIEAQNLATSVLNVVSDSAILALPQSIIWRLQMPRAKKIGVSLLFVVGVAFVCPSIVPNRNSREDANSPPTFRAWVFGVIRSVYLVWLLKADDALHLMTGVIMWTMWEITAGLLVIGIPAVPRVYKVLALSGSGISWLHFASRRPPQGGSLIAPHRQLDEPRIPKRRGLWEISELQTQDVESMDSATASNDTAVRAIEKPSMCKSEYDVMRSRDELILQDWSASARRLYFGPPLTSRSDE